MQFLILLRSIRNIDRIGNSKLFRTEQKKLFARLIYLNSVCRLVKKPKIIRFFSFFLSVIITNNLILVFATTKHLREGLRLSKLNKIKKICIN